MRFQYFLSIRYNMPSTMKSRSLSKRRMRSLRRHCSSKNHRRALRSRSLRTRKMHRKLCKGVRRKTARKRNRHTKKCPKGKHRRLHGQRRGRRGRITRHGRLSKKCYSNTKRRSSKRRRRHRGGDGTTNYSSGLMRLSPSPLDRALGAS